MIKIIFCDDGLKLRNKKLISAFNHVFKKQKMELLYLTIEHEDIVVYGIKDMEWIRINKKMEEVLANSYILLDTLWSSDIAQVIKEKIINWCSKYNLYEKIFVYTRFSRDDADLFIGDLERKKINVSNSSFIMIDDESYEQFLHFALIFQALQNDIERKNDIYE